MITDGLNWNSLVGGVALLGILSVLGYAAIGQGQHDALVALISLVTGVGIGAGTVSQKPASIIARSVIEKPKSPETPTPPTGAS